MNLRVYQKWERVMMLSMVIGTVSRPLDFYIGYKFGVGDYWAFGIGMLLSAGLAILAELIWWKVMSAIKGEGSEE